jgi:hypothetical protein
VVSVCVVLVRARVEACACAGVVDLQVLANRIHSTIASRTGSGWLSLLARRFSNAWNTGRQWVLGRFKMKLVRLRGRGMMLARVAPCIRGRALVGGTRWMLLRCMSSKFLPLSLKMESGALM